MLYGREWRNKRPCASRASTICTCAGRLKVPGDFQKRDRAANLLRWLAICGLVLPLAVMPGGVSARSEGGRDRTTSGISPIRIEYRQQRLGTLARDLERRSGISISVPRELADDRMSGDARAAGWSDIVKQVLEDYDYAAVINHEGQMQRIFLQARINRAAVPASHAEPHPSRRGRNRTGGDGSAKSASLLPRRFRGLNPGSVAPIDIPFARLDKLKSGDSISLTFRGEPTQWFHDRRWLHESGETSWVGRSEGTSGNDRVVLTYGADGSAVGHVHTRSGDFKIEQADGKTWAIDMNASGLQPGTLAEDQQTVGMTGSALSATHFLAASSAHPSTVDLMVLYAPGVNEDQPVTRVNHLIALTRQSFVDSAIFVDLRLVHTAAVEDDGQTPNVDLLRNLTDNRFSQDVAALRNGYGADLVLLVRPFHPSAQGNCGVAWVAGSNQQPPSRDAGFAVVSDGYDSNYYCHDYTFAHELGHLFGNVHDQPISDPGIFPFSYAWGIPGEFSTIMSYLFDQAPLVGKFANPSIACPPSGKPCGTQETADNARTINLTAPTIASFADTAVP